MDPILIIYIIALLLVTGLQYVCWRNIFFKNFRHRNWMAVGATIVVLFTIYNCQYAPFKIMVDYQLIIIGFALLLVIYRYCRKKNINNRSLKIATIVAVGLAITLLITVFALGYRIPKNDKHPEWKDFPNNSNKNIEIIEINKFEEKYGDRYKITPEPEIVLENYSFERCYQYNVKNLQSLDFVPLSNHFEMAELFSLKENSFIYERGQRRKFYAYFYQEGLEYLEMNVGDQKMYFKVDQSSPHTQLSCFYQYNIPNSQNDTLFLRYFDIDYKAYVKRKN